MSLEVSFLDQRDPHLSFVTVSADGATVAVYGHVVVNLDTSPAAVQIQFDNILSFRVINRVRILVLWVNVVADQPMLVSMLELMMSCDSEGAQD